MAGIDFESGHEVNDEREDDELDEEYWEIANSPGDYDGRRSIHGETLVFGEDGSARESSGRLGETDQ